MRKYKAGWAVCERDCTQSRRIMPSVHDTLLPSIDPTDHHGIGWI